MYLNPVQVLNAAKPAPEKKEESQRLISLYVDEVKSDMVTLSVQTQGEVRPKTEIDLIPQVSGRIVAISGSSAPVKAHQKKTGNLRCPLAGTEESSDRQECLHYR